MGSKFIDKEKYEFEDELTSFLARVGDIEIPYIKKAKSKWDFLVQPKPDQGTCEDGVLFREGDITFINPDKEAPISLINVQIDEKIHFWHGRQELDFSIIKLMAFPRDIHSLDNKGRGSFRDIMDRTFPLASYKNDNSIYYSAQNLGTDIENFILKHYGEKSGLGLPVLRVYKRQKDREYVSALHILGNSNVWSKNPKLRAAFCACLSRIFEGEEPQKQIDHQPRRQIAASPLALEAAAPTSQNGLKAIER